LIAARYHNKRGGGKWESKSKEIMERDFEGGAILQF